MEVVKLIYTGDYPRDFPGIGTFQPGKEYQIDNPQKAGYLLGLRVRDPETGREVGLFEVVPEPEVHPAAKPAAAKKKTKEADVNGDTGSAKHSTDGA